MIDKKIYQHSWCYAQFDSDSDSDVQKPSSRRSIPQIVVEMVESSDESVGAESQTVLDQLTFDDSEFYSPEISDGEEGEEVTSNGAARIKSETDHNWLDTSVELVDSDCQSCEERLEGATNSTPIPWSPRRINCNVVQCVDQDLQRLHEEFPYLARAEPGRVVNMEPILQAISGSEDEGIRQAISESEDEGARYGARRKVRHNYKKLHTNGFSE